MAEIIGIFEVSPCPDPVYSGKWTFRNTLNGFTHKTFGTEAEIRALALKQSRAWQVRLKISGGNFMRQHAFGDGGIVKNRAKVEKVEKELDDVSKSA